MQSKRTEYKLGDVVQRTHPPAIHSFQRARLPSFLDLRRSLIVSLVVSLMAFSGDTPTNWGSRPGGRGRMGVGGGREGGGEEGRREERRRRESSNEKVRVNIIHKEKLAR